MRYLLLLPLLLAACDSPRLAGGSLDVPMGGAPRGTSDPRLDACRAEATRVVQFRERGQLMRTDETESGRGFITVAPYSRAENDRASAQLTRDQMIQDCLRQGSAQGQAPGR
ncbi:hypothetical protein [Roseomonas sp. AR75]|uniref:hypothetical protein n=1 Tax=Roseomonas sp. AR75 TaxID=2562311 RepID=UPI0010C0325F|nr:hypothetical protein [Roseomonas sp. AR75]